MDPIIATLIVLVIFIIGMLSGKLPFGVISIGCTLLLAVFGVIDPLTALSGFTNKNVLLMASMFVLAMAFGKTSVIDKIQEKLLSGNGGKSDLAIVATVMIASVIMAQFIPSQVSIIMIMLSFVSSLGTEGEVNVNRLLVPMTFVITFWMGRLPIGGLGVSGYIVYNGMIEAAGGTSDQLLNVLSTIKSTWLPAICVLVYCIVTYKMIPNNTKSGDQSAFQSKKQEKQKLPKSKEIIIYVCFIGTIIGMLLSSKIGNWLYVLAAIADIILLLTGCITERETLSTLANPAVFMAAGVMVISDALTSSGAGDLIGTTILNLLGGDPSPLLLLIVVGLTSALLTSFTSNTATIYVLCPIVATMCVNAGYDPRAAVICAQVCAVSSVITPMASNGAALAYAASGVNFKDILHWSIPLTLMVVVTTIINCYFAYPM